MTLMQMGDPDSNPEQGVGKKNCFAPTTTR